MSQPQAALSPNPCAVRQGLPNTGATPPRDLASTSASSSGSPADSSETLSSLETPPKRLRLRTKTTEEAPIRRLVLPSADDADHEVRTRRKEGGPIWKDLRLTVDRRLYYNVRYRLRSWAKEGLKKWNNDEPHQFSRRFYEILAGAWTGDEGVMSTIVHALERTHAPQEVLDWSREVWGAIGPDGEYVPPVNRRMEKLWLNAHQSLMTWNGEWGLLEEKDGVCPAPTDWRELVAHVRNRPRAQALWQEFLIFVKDAVIELFINDWAASMELCMNTWEEQGQLRIHMHLCWKSSQKVRLKRHDPLVFRGTPPHASATIATLQSRVSGSWCGLYYLTCPKIGVIESTSTKQAFTQFPVSAEWVFSMLQSRKMELCDARKEIIKCGKGLVRKLADLDKLAQMKMEVKLEERIALVQTEIAKTNLTFKTFPVIEKWKEDSMRDFQRRKKFLVMEGPSGVGKTEYVRGLFGSDALLELNAANCGRSPDLRQFNPAKHKVVLFDEASVELVLENRKLFQAPACWIDLGHSPTGMNVYRVFLNDSCLVIASNRWREQLQAIKNLSDRLWIEANQVLVMITEKMFVESAEE